MSKREAELEKEVKALRSKLSLCEADKTALQSDVEMLCLQTTSLSSSSVLQERVIFTGAEEEERLICRGAEEL